MNSSNISDPDHWFYDESWNWFTWHIFIWLFPLICLMGAVMNACAFSVIATNRKTFPYVTRQYMLVITMHDVIVLSLKASTHYLRYMSSYVRYNAWTWYKIPEDTNFLLCNAYYFFTYYFLSGALFFPLGLTIDRFIAVAFPLKARQILTKKRSWILLLVLTVMALSLPTFFVTNLSWDREEGVCMLEDDHYYRNVYQKFQVYFGCFLFSVMILGTAAICILLIWNNRAAEKMKLGLGATSRRKQNRSLIRITLILILSNFAFLATSLPFNIVTMPNLHEQLEKQMGKNNYIILCRHLNTLLYANNALTWMSYFMGSNFRRAFCVRFAPRCFAAAAAARQTSGWRQQSGQPQIIKLSV